MLLFYLQLYTASKSNKTKLLGNFKLNVCVIMVIL